MSIDLDRLPNKVYPVTQTDKVNEIVDVVNNNLNMYYTATNPVLTPIAGSASWVVTHNLGTENITCTLYEGDDLIVSKIAVTSENTVTVYLNSLVEVPADTYKITIVTNGGANLSGSGDITIDSSLSTTSENPVQNKVVASALDAKLNKSSVDSNFYAASENPVQNRILYPYYRGYIPAETDFRIKADGTGNFPTINDAIDYLYNKWSNGVIYITLEAGTHYISRNSTIQNLWCNLPHILIRGESESSTFLVGSSDFDAGSGDWFFFNFWAKTNIVFSNLTFKKGNNSNVTGCIVVGVGCNISIFSCTFEDFSGALVCQYGGKVTILDSFTVKNFSGWAINSMGGGYITSNWGTAFTFTNPTSKGTAFGVMDGGQIHITEGGSTFTYTKVANKTNKTVGTANSQGWITGVS